jgi:tRNA (guanine37-N1)-methyltransferase
VRIDIITALPKLVESPFSDSILKRAIQNGIVELVIHDLKEFGLGKNRQIDDYQFGGGAGMVMMIEPIEKASKPYNQKGSMMKSFI